MSLSVSLTQSSEDTEAETEDQNREEEPEENLNPEDLKGTPNKVTEVSEVPENVGRVDEKSSEEESLEEALMSILEHFSDED